VSTATSDPALAAFATDVLAAAVVALGDLGGELGGLARDLGDRAGAARAACGLAEREDRARSASFAAALAAEVLGIHLLLERRESAALGLILEHTRRATPAQRAQAKHFAHAVSTHVGARDWAAPFALAFLVSADPVRRLGASGAAHFVEALLASSAGFSAAERRAVDTLVPAGRWRMGKRRARWYAPAAAS